MNCDKKKMRLRGENTYEVMSISLHVYTCYVVEQDSAFHCGWNEMKKQIRHTQLEEPEAEVCRELRGIPG